MAALVLFLSLSQLLPLLIHTFTSLSLSIEDFERVAMGAQVIPQRLVIFALRQQLKVEIEDVLTF